MYCLRSNILYLYILIFRHCKYNILDLNSSSSSDVSDDTSDSELYRNKSIESLSTLAQFEHTEENELPLGCDPKLFASTFDLRSQRYEIEQLIEGHKVKLKSSNNNLNNAYAELTVIENDLNLNKDKLNINRVRILLVKGN